MGTPQILLCTLPIVAPGAEYKYMDDTKAYRQPRLGVQSIRDYLVRFDYCSENIHFLDIEMLAPSDEQLSKYLNDLKPKILGLGAVLSHSYQQVKRISKLARKVLPDVWIVLGGHLTATSNVLLRKTEADICIVGDGEEPFLDLFNMLARMAERNYLASCPGSLGCVF